MCGAVNEQIFFLFKVEEVRGGEGGGSEKYNNFINFEYDSVVKAFQDKQLLHNTTYLLSNK